MSEVFTHWVKVLVGFAILALVAKLVFGLAFRLSFLVFAAWVFIGFLVQFDDFLPDGWSNPDGSEPIPWIELSLRFCVFLGAVVLFATGAER